MIKKEVPVPDVGTFSLCLFTDQVWVELDPLDKSNRMQPIGILWEELTDFEVLFEKCKEMQLKSFKPVAEALGVIYTNRALYEELLK